MQRLLLGIALAGLLAWSAGVPAEAGGKGAVKVDLNRAEWNANLQSVVVEPPFAVGHATFNTTASGKMNVSVVLKGGPPDTFFEVRGLPAGSWPILGDFTTNKKGHGTLQAQHPIPTTAIAADGTVLIAVSVRTERGVDPVYRTYDTPVPVK